METIQIIDSVFIDITIFLICVYQCKMDISTSLIFNFVAYPKA